MSSLEMDPTLFWYHRLPLLFGLVFILVKTCSVHSATSTVEYLPGFQGPLPFHLETGYVGVGESEDVQLFYYFVRSERNPKKDPLLLWLTGGPGCTGWSGLAYEIGPVNYKIQKYDGSVPTLVLNQYSWTKISNIIFIDSPSGSGFSYTKNSSANHSGDIKQGDNLLHFFNKWLISHPEYISNPIYIAGDSYSGIIVPLLAQHIANGIKEGIIPPIDLKGYILGNPKTYSQDLNYRIPFAHRMTLISDELYKSLEKSCGGEYTNIDPNNTECLKNFQAYQKCISGIYEKHILEDNCALASPKPQDMISERRSLNENFEASLLFDSKLPFFGCREYDHLLSYYWANNPHVREALRVQKGTVGEWLRCNHFLRDNLYKFDVPTSIPYHVDLSARGYRSLIYSGDHDLAIPNLGTQAWIKSLNYSIVDDWRPWIVQGQVAGYTRSYSNRMTFATVKGAGHTAAQYKPKECFAMFKRWIEHESL